MPFFLNSDIRTSLLFMHQRPLHLETAIHAGCSQFWTNDKKLVKAAGKSLMVMDWATLEEMM